MRNPRDSRLCIELSWQGDPNVPPREQLTQYHPWAGAVFDLAFPSVSSFTATAPAVHASGVAALSFIQHILGVAPDWALETIGAMLRGAPQDCPGLTASASLSIGMPTVPNGGRWEAVLSVWSN